MFFDKKREQEPFDLNTASIFLKSSVEKNLTDKILKWEKGKSKTYLMTSIAIGKYLGAFTAELNAGGQFLVRCYFPMAARPKLNKLSWEIFSTAYENEESQTGLQLIFNQFCVRAEDMEGMLDKLFRSLKHPNTEQKINESLC